MPQIKTGWVASDADRQPAQIVESHIVKPGETATFTLAGVTVTNRGQREAGVFLRKDGDLVADVPIEVGRPEYKAYRRGRGTCCPAIRYGWCPRHLGARRSAGLSRARRW